MDEQGGCIAVYQFFALRQVAESTIEKAHVTFTSFIYVFIKLTVRVVTFCLRAIDMQHYMLH